MLTLLRLTLVVFNVVLMMTINESTPGIYHSTHKCSTPSLEHAGYMGGVNKIGTDLLLFVNNVSYLEMIDKQLQFNNHMKHNVIIRDKNENFQQFIVDVNVGKIELNNAFARKLCNDKQVLVSMDSQELQFQWSLNANNNNENEVVFTIAYAPYYTQAFIQSFKIPLSLLYDSNNKNNNDINNNDVIDRSNNADDNDNNDQDDNNDHNTNDDGDNDHDDNDNDNDDNDKDDDDDDDNDNHNDDNDDNDDDDDDDDDDDKYDL